MPKLDMNLPKADVDMPGVAATRTTGWSGGKRDDLTLVEGIGPKIAGLLRNAGIHTFRELSETSVERLQQILDDAGSNFNRANPGTWPEQARLAADGLMDELKALQDSLTGGVMR